jgi:bacterioferritin
MAEKTTAHPGAGILSDANTAKREEILELLTRAYWMEAETVLSYLANAANLDGIRAEEIAEALDEDVSRGPCSRATRPTWPA